MKLPFDLKDYYALVGIVLIGIGCWRIYPPAALILVGLVFLKMASAK
jgi:hypothetical protein